MVTNEIVAIVADNGERYCGACAAEFAIVADGTLTAEEVGEPCCQACGVTSSQTCYSCGDPLDPNRGW